MTKTILLPILSVFVFLLNSFGQTNDAKLTDDFGKIGCESYLARVQYFYSALQSNPSAVGYLIIQGDSKFLRTKLAYESWWYGALQEFGLDESRVIKIRGAENGDFKIQFWIVPPGAAPPASASEKWNFTFSPNLKPFILHDDMEQICYSPKFVSIYKEFLDAKPGARANVVIRAPSRSKYLAELKKIELKLFGIPHKRIRYYYLRTNSTDTVAQYWLVPQKRLYLKTNLTNRK